MRHLASRPAPTAVGPAGSHHRSRRGFTILEVMIAAAVMALAISSAIAVMGRGFSSVDTARNLTIAGQIMQSELEKVRMKDWSEIVTYSTTEQDITSTLDASFTSNTFIGTRFRVYRLATDINMGTGIGMRELKFTCRWTGYDGRSYSRSYTTYYGQSGLYDFFYNSL